MDLPLSSFCRTEKSAVPSAAGTTISPSRMAEAEKKSVRGRKQDRARVAKGQDYEVRYEAKTGRSASAVKKAVKKVGNSRKRVEKGLGR